MNYYQTNYQLLEKHNYSLFEIESMIPWEREIYVSMIAEDIKRENQMRQEQQFG